jgi:hypothetical protein
VTLEVTRDKLIELAELETMHRAENSGLVSSYLIGSVAAGNPILGDTADVDLILIHEHEPSTQREIQRLSEYIHLDIYHHPKKRYMQPRELRIDPWIGPSLSAPVFIYDPQHFFEWAQAGARGQFFRSDHVFRRASALFKRARQAMSLLPLSNRWLKTYARIALEATNAVVTLTGKPAAGRRLAIEIEQTTKDAGHPEVYQRFLQLLGGDALNTTLIPQWLSAWGYAFDTAAAISKEPELNPCRRMYYLKGFQALVDADRPEAILWKLLTTWERAIHTLAKSDNAAPHQAAWDSVRQRLRLSPKAMNSRAEELEEHLQSIEHLLSAWAEEVGV